MLRSMLFVPGNRPSRVAKALDSTADAVILDLEDAVPEEEKVATRSAVRAVLTAPRRGALYVRVNGTQTPWCFADLEYAVGPGLTGVMLSKTHSAEDVVRADWVMQQWERNLSLANRSIDLIPLVESAIGVSNLGSIAAASPRIRRLAFGAGDFCFDLGVMPDLTPEQMIYPRSAFAIASRAAGLEGPIDAVWPDVTDSSGLARDTDIGKRMGFQGRLLIHPDQIAPVHAAYAPSTKEKAWAAEVVAAYDSAVAEGKGAVRVQGMLVDLPVAVYARRLLARADLAGAGETNRRDRTDG